MRNHVRLRNDWILLLSSGMVRILREISVARIIVLLISVVSLYVMGQVIMRIIIMINTCPFVKVIVVRVTHWIVKVEKIVRVVPLKMMLSSLSSPLFSFRNLFHLVIMLLSQMLFLFLVPLPIIVFIIGVIVVGVRVIGKVWVMIVLFFSLTLLLP